MKALKQLNKHGKTIEQMYTTVWQFKDTTQQPIQYKGRCIPEIPRYCIERFSKEGDLILDAFMGSGTTIGEAIALGRNVIGVDPSDTAHRLTEKRLKTYYPKKTLLEDRQSTAKLLKEDVRNLPLDSKSIDMVFAHIPYWSVITYTTPEEKNSKDLSRIWSLEKFNKEMANAYTELYRVLKDEKYCCILVGDVRQGGRKIPMGIIHTLLLMEAGFQFFDLFIKVTDNAISMRRPEVVEKATNGNRTITIHEYIIVVKKTKTKNDIGLKFLLKKL